MIIDPITAVPDQISKSVTGQKIAIRSLENADESLFSSSSATSMLKEGSTQLSEPKVKDDARDLEEDPEVRLTMRSRASPEAEERSRSMSPPLRSQPSLPAGFSSIMARRQITRALPLRTAFPTHIPAIRPTHITFDSVMVDAVPETPSLLSPRAAEFTTTPFHRTAAGDLAGSSFYEQALLSRNSAERDPRSPPAKGEAPITRSIDDML